MIRVLHAEAIPISFRLAEGYRIAGHTYTSADNIIVKIDTSDGRTGFGCAAPAAEVTGETPAAALLALQDRLVPLLRASDAADTAGFARRAGEARATGDDASGRVDAGVGGRVGSRVGRGGVGGSRVGGRGVGGSRGGGSGVGGSGGGGSSVVDGAIGRGRVGLRRVGQRRIDRRGVALPVIVVITGRTAAARGERDQRE